MILLLQLNSKPIYLLLQHMRIKRLESNVNQYPHCTSINTTSTLRSYCSHTRL